MENSVDVIRENVESIDTFENRKSVVDFLVASLGGELIWDVDFNNYARTLFANGNTLEELLAISVTRFRNMFSAHLAQKVVEHLRGFKFIDVEFKNIECSAEFNLAEDMSDTFELEEIWDTFRHLEDFGTLDYADNACKKTIEWAEGIAEDLIDNGDLDVVTEIKDDDEAVPEDSHNLVDATFLVKTKYSYEYNELKKRFMHRLNHKMNPKIVLYSMTHSNGTYVVRISFILEGNRNVEQVASMLNYRFGKTSPRKWYACELHELSVY